MPRILITGEDNFLRGRDNNEWHMAVKDPEILLVTDRDLTQETVEGFDRAHARW